MARTGIVHRFLSPTYLFPSFSSRVVVEQACLRLGQRWRRVPASRGPLFRFPFPTFLPLHLLSPLRYARRRGLGFWLQRVLHSRVAFSPVVSSLSVGASARRTRGWWLAAVGVLGWKSRSFPLRSRLASMYCRWFAASGPRSHRP